MFAAKFKDLYNSVPLKSTRHDDCVISVEEVKCAAQALKSNKSNGDIGLWSDHIKRGGNLVHHHIASLLTAVA